MGKVGICTVLYKGRARPVSAARGRSGAGPLAGRQGVETTISQVGEWKCGESRLGCTCICRVFVSPPLVLVLRLLRGPRSRVVLGAEREQKQEEKETA